MPTLSGRSGTTLILSALILGAATPRALVAEEAPGGIAGRVYDVANNVLPGASVDIEPRGIRLVTDREGRFAASNLPAGEYKVEVSYLGFKDDHEDVKVASGVHVSIEPKLSPQLSESVTVSAGRQYG